MTNWMRDYEERTTERNERVYQLIVERLLKEERQIQSQNTDNSEKKDIKYKNYNDGIQKLLWDEQHLLTK